MLLSNCDVQQKDFSINIQRFFFRMMTVRDEWQRLRILFLFMTVTILVGNQLQWEPTTMVNVKFSSTNLEIKPLQLEGLDGDGNVAVEEVIWQTTMAQHQSNQLQSALRVVPGKGCQRQQKNLMMKGKQFNMWEKNAKTKRKQSDGREKNFNEADKNSIYEVGHNTHKSRVS